MADKGINTQSYKNIKALMSEIGLWRFVIETELSLQDRIYCRISSTLPTVLRSRKDFKLSNKVGAIHKELGKYFYVKEEDGIYTTWRQRSKPSLQITILEELRLFQDEPSVYFADIDIDLANPFYDIIGGMIHALEILIPGKTDQDKVREKLINKGIWVD